MIVPPAMTIEAAIDQLKSQDAFAGHEWVLPAQRKELSSVVPSASDDFKAGYELGIQTSRVLLSGMPSAVLHDVSI
jgi:hypothetical protein